MDLNQYVSFRNTATKGGDFISQIERNLSNLASVESYATGGIDNITRVLQIAKNTAANSIKRLNFDEKTAETFLSDFQLTFSGLFEDKDFKNSYIKHLSKIANAKSEQEVDKSRSELISKIKKVINQKIPSIKFVNDEYLDEYIRLIEDRLFASANYEPIQAALKHRRLTENEKKAFIITGSVLLSLAVAAAASVFLAAHFPVILSSGLIAAVISFCASNLGMSLILGTAIAGTTSILIGTLFDKSNEFVHDKFNIDAKNFDNTVAGPAELEQAKAALTIAVANVFPYLELKSAYQGVKANELLESIDILNQNILTCKAEEATKAASPNDLKKAYNDYWKLSSVKNKDFEALVGKLKLVELPANTDLRNLSDETKDFLLFKAAVIARNPEAAKKLEPMINNFNKKYDEFKDSLKNVRGVDFSVAV